LRRARSGGNNNRTIFYIKSLQSYLHFSQPSKKSSYAKNDPNSFSTVDRRTSGPFCHGRLELEADRQDEATEQAILQPRSRGRRRPSSQVERSRPGRAPPPASTLGLYGLTARGFRRFDAGERLAAASWRRSRSPRGSDARSGARGCWAVERDWEEGADFCDRKMNKTGAKAFLFVRKARPWRVITDGQVAAARSDELGGRNAPAKSHREIGCLYLRTRSRPPGGSRPFQWSSLIPRR
jgi:hypothetical protein